MEETTSALILRRFAAFEREQRQAQTTELGKHAIESRLIREHADELRAAIWLLHDLKSLQPVLPRGVQLLLDANTIDFAHHGPRSSYSLSLKRVQPDRLGAQQPKGYLWGVGGGEGRQEEAR